MEFDKTLLAGSTGLMLLKLLEQEDMYGYQMIETLRSGRSTRSTSRPGRSIRFCTRLSRRAISPRGPTVRRGPSAPGIIT